jgi:hypothetical protein
MTIHIIRTDEEVIREAAIKLAIAVGSEWDQACADMVEALQYGRSIAWWSQFERQTAKVA